MCQRSFLFIFSLKILKQEARRQVVQRLGAYTTKIQMRKFYSFCVALVIAFSAVNNVNAQISNQPTAPSDAEPGRSVEQTEFTLFYKVNINLHSDPFESSQEGFLGPWVQIQTSPGYTFLGLGGALAGETYGTKFGATFIAEHLTGTVYPCLYLSQKLSPWGTEAGHSLSLWGRVTAHEGLSYNYGLEIASNNVEISFEKWRIQKQFSYVDLELRIRPNAEYPQFSLGIIHRRETKIFPLAGSRFSKSTGITVNWALWNGLPNY